MHLLPMLFAALLQAAAPAPAPAPARSCASGSWPVTPRGGSSKRCRPTDWRDGSNCQA